MAICTGCGRNSKNMREYNKRNPVEYDGTYANGLFVCTKCYTYLITLGVDVGSPQQIQNRARNYVKR